MLVAVVGCLGLLAAFLKVNFGNFTMTTDIKILMMAAVILFGGFALYNFVGLKKDLSHNNFFGSLIVFMVLLTMFTSVFVFNFVVGFGQIDLINFGKYAKQNELKLATFDFGHRYSAIFLAR